MADVEKARVFTAAERDAIIRDMPSLRADCDIADGAAPFVPGEHFTVNLKSAHWTKFARQMVGMPVAPRASRGWRRHVRRVKAARP